MSNADDIARGKAIFESGKYGHLVYDDEPPPRCDEPALDGDDTDRNDELPKDGLALIPGLPSRHYGDVVPTPGC